MIRVETAATTEAIGRGDPFLLTADTEREPLACYGDPFLPDDCPALPPEPRDPALALLRPVMAMLVGMHAFFFWMMLSRGDLIPAGIFLVMLVVAIIKLAYLSTWR